MLLAGFLGASLFGAGEGASAGAYLASSALCITAIACLSQHATARAGNALGIVGVGGGIAVAMYNMSAAPAVYAQAAALLGAGAATGHLIASNLRITELPEMVAAFHSLVGLAATATAIANVAMVGGADMGALDTMHRTTAFLGDVIGAVTLTGSAVAFGKLVSACSDGRFGCW